ncbi:GNAT family N-acetyltransferase, partial [Agromyces seonyuensis]
RPGPALRPPDGAASLPADEPAAAFALAHGYELAQLDRVSRLDVGGRSAEFAATAAAAAARVPGYRVESWEGATPDSLVDAYARARTRMALDVPAGGLEIDEEPWDADRVRAREGRMARAGSRVLVTAALDPGGAVAGYTELELTAGKRVAQQADTLVVPEHRGHGLGMLVKAANIVRLAELAPERTGVLTWNADENDHMLAINVALGFRVVGYEAAWQRASAPPPRDGDPGAIA